MLCVKDIIGVKEAEIEIVLSTFDYRSAKHHLSRVMDIINTPEFYVYLISSQQDNA